MAELLLVALVALAGVKLLVLGVRDQWARWAGFAAHGLAYPERNCSLPFCDYALFFHAGRLAWEGDAGAVYDSARFFAASGQTGADALPFVYPPVMLPLAAVMGWPPLAVGYGAFTLASTLLALWLLRRAGIAWACIALGLLDMPAAWNLYLGQFGLLCGAGLIFGLARLETRPWISGIVLGCLAIKPQYALLVPVVVLSARNWRALAGGGAVLAVLLILPVFLAGWQSWGAYLGPGRSSLAALMDAPFSNEYKAAGDSVFWMARSFGAGLAAAYGAQALAAAMAAALAWRLWRQAVSAPGARLAATVFLTLLASPYEFPDDFVAYAVMVPLLARREAKLTNGALAVLWVAPAIAAICLRRYGFMPMPVFVGGALWVAWGRLWTVDEAAVSGARLAAA